VNVSHQRAGIIAGAPNGPIDPSSVGNMIFSSGKLRILYTI
jgi:hypothetical protein